MKRQAGDTDGDIVPAQLVSGPDDAEAAPTIRFVNSPSSVPSASAPATSTSSPAGRNGGSYAYRRSAPQDAHRPANLQSTVISRLKTMGGMNISGA